MQLEIEESLKIEEGKHKGVITSVTYRDQPFKYTDIHVKVGEMELTYSCPTKVTAESKLGKLLEMFGITMVVGFRLDPEAVLKGKKCSVIVVKEKTAKGEFAKIAKISPRVDTNA